jgi:hypothetical protein
LILRLQGKVQDTNVERKVIHRVIAEPGGPAGKAKKLVYKILIPKSTAQGSQAEISSQPIFAHILLCIQGGIDQQKGISPLRFFTSILSHLSPKIYLQHLGANRPTYTNMLVRRRIAMQSR